MESMDRLKYLITGATGFVGANLVREFINNEEVEVHIIARESSNFWRIKDIIKKVIVHYCDLNNQEEIKGVVSNIKPDVIIHNAIYGGYSFQKDSSLIFNTNFVGTVNLVNACIENEFICFINTGSSSEYGIKNKSMSETDLLEPIDDYGVAKASATLYCQSIAKRYNLPIFTLRLFSPYGYYEESTRLIPYIILNCLKNNEIKLSNPNPVRDFIFIEDVVDAYELVIKNVDKLNCGEIINIGSGMQHTVKDVFDLIKNITEYKKEPVWGGVDGRISDIKKIWQADIKKAQNLINWRPNYSFEDGMYKNVKWFKDHIKLYK